jgi:hypothetical protein
LKLDLSEILNADREGVSGHRINPSKGNGECGVGFADAAELKAKAKQDVALKPYEATISYRALMALSA